MSSVLLPVILLAGLSEAAGRLLPVVSRRSSTSVRIVAGLLVAGAFIEATVIALWPVVASSLAHYLLPTDAPEARPIGWTADVAAPLVMAAILALPLLGPPLHLMLLCGVGATLAGPLADASGLSWGAAAGCLAVAGIALAATAGIVRRLVARAIAGSAPEPDP